MLDGFHAGLKWSLKEPQFPGVVNIRDSRVLADITQSGGLMRQRGMMNRNTVEHGYNKREASLSLY